MVFFSQVLVMAKSKLIAGCSPSSLDLSASVNDIFLLMFITLLLCV